MKKSAVGLRDRVVSFGKKAAVAVSASVVSASAFAQDMPTTVDGAAEWLTTKGAVAIAIAGAVTLLVIGITAAKLPRRGA